MAQTVVLLLAGVLFGALAVGWWRGRLRTGALGRRTGTGAALPWLAAACMGLAVVSVLVREPSGAGTAAAAVLYVATATAFAVALALFVYAPARFLPPWARPTGGAHVSLGFFAPSAGSAATAAGYWERRIPVVDVAATLRRPAVPAVRVDEARGAVVPADLPAAGGPGARDAGPLRRGRLQARRTGALFVEDAVEVVAGTRGLVVWLPRTDVASVGAARATVSLWVRGEAEPVVVDLGSAAAADQTATTLRRLLRRPDSTPDR